MRLAGKTAIVTGAAQGLGFAVAQRFVAEGANVVVADINGAKAEKAVAGLSSSGGGEAIACAADIGDDVQVKSMVDLALDRFGSVDILVNNAGGSGRSPAIDIEDVTIDAWDQVIRQNLRGTFLCCRTVVPHMKSRRYGRIVNVSSGLATGRGRLQSTGGTLLAYASAKAGILGLTYTLAKAVARFNITVNAVVPGFMLTEPGARVRDWFDTLTPEGQKALMSRSEIGRAGEPSEFASLVVFLSSEECSFVSGDAININGAS